MPLPNKRLKLTGGDRFKGSGVLGPGGARDVRPLLLRRRATRPQLKRDPLDSAKWTRAKTRATTLTSGRK